MTMQYTEAQLELHKEHKARQARLSAAASKARQSRLRMDAHRKDAFPVPSPDIYLDVIKKAIEKAKPFEGERDVIDVVSPDYIIFEPPQTISAKTIQRVIAKHHGCAVDDLLSPRKLKEIVIPRMIAMFCVWAIIPRHSLPEIGRRFGGRDHTTILHAVRKLCKQYGAANRAAAEPIARQIMTDAGYIWPEQQTEGEGE